MRNSIQEPPRETTAPRPLWPWLIALGFTLSGVAGAINLAPPPDAPKQQELVFDVEPLDLSARIDDPEDSLENSPESHPQKPEEPKKTPEPEQEREEKPRTQPRAHSAEALFATKVPPRRAEQTDPSPARPASKASESAASPRPDVHPQFTEAPPNADLVRQRAIELRQRRKALLNRRNALPANQRAEREEITQSLADLNQEARKLLEQARALARESEREEPGPAAGAVSQAPPPEQAPRGHTPVHND